MGIHIDYKPAGRLLNPAGGYLEGYSHTLNPYSGCIYGCSYCYVRQMPPGLFHAEPWGKWTTVKTGVRERLEKEMNTAAGKGPVHIFMSSSTDPYQPIEFKAQVTRSILEAFAHRPPDFLFVQTRSPLVTRDADLFAKLKDRILISITVETDLEPVRRRFTPKAPPIAARIRAMEKLLEAGLPVQAAVSPILPSSRHFPAQLPADLTSVVLDDFFMGDGSGGRRTERLGIQGLYVPDELDKWYRREETLRRVHARFREYFPEERIRLSREGFMPIRQK